MPTDILKNVEKWLDSISDLNKLEILRWFNHMNATSKLCLHVFADTSEVAYGAVVYVVLKSHEQNYSSFIVGKSCVSANKQQCWFIP